MTTLNCRRLAQGEIFDDLAGPRGEGWRVIEGALRLDPIDGPSRPALVALPGDLLGLEVSTLDHCPYRLRALLPARLQALAPPVDAEEARSRLNTVLRQQWRRAVQMSGLRTGGVPDRVKHLLVMLRACGDDGEVLTPRLRDLAATVDSTPESVSRVIANLRRLHLISGEAYERRHHASHALAGATLPAGMTSGRLAMAPLLP